MNSLSRKLHIIERQIQEATNPKPKTNIYHTRSQELERRLKAIENVTENRTFLVLKTYADTINDPTVLDVRETVE